MRFFLNLCVLLMAVRFTVLGAEKNFPMRMWTSVNGNQIEGAFVKESDGKVFLRRPNGKLVATKRVKLSPDDLAWIAARTGEKKAEGDVLSFEKPSRTEINHMPNYRRIKRIIIKTYTKLTNNDRDDKMLGFLVRDASSVFGWMAAVPECYPLPDGRKGKLKRIAFKTVHEIPIKEAVQMAQDKFQLRLPYPIVAKRTRIDEGPCWEIQNPPDYVTHVYLVETEDQTGKTPTIGDFILEFPPPPSSPK